MLLHFSHSPHPCGLATQGAVAEFAVNSPKIITGDVYEVKGCALDAFTSASAPVHFLVRPLNLEKQRP